jgi:hypothetical protein
MEHLIPIWGLIKLKLNQKNTKWYPVKAVLLMLYNYFIALILGLLTYYIWM